jgi:hypothetical protein
MRKSILLICSVLSGLGVAKVCDKSYHLQEAYEFLFTGSSKNSLTSAPAAFLDKAMTKATLLHDSTAYKIVTDWDASGSCDAWVKREVTYSTREFKKPFETHTVTNNFVRFFDGSYTYKKPGWDEYWFGIADEMHGDTALLSEEVGKFKGQSQLNLWYGASTIKITTRTKNGALVRTQTGFLKSAASHPDSAALATDLLKSWDKIPVADTETVDYTLQLIRIRYDSVPSPASGLIPRKAHAAGFQARRTGNLVLIQTGEKAVGTQPLGLYNMLGNKVAAIHPTGYHYQWNGLTAGGSEAPTGVYFVQAGNRVLGKFFFSR